MPHIKDGRLRTLYFEGLALLDAGFYPEAFKIFQFIERHLRLQGGDFRAKIRRISAVTGAALGVALPGVGNLIGGAAGAVVGHILGHRAAEFATDLTDADFLLCLQLAKLHARLGTP